MPQPSRPALKLFITVTAAALLLRWLQVFFQQADPLFYNPLGGNLPYLLMGERIAAGEWLPLDGRPFSISSPLYPWIAGAVFRIVGASDAGALRIAGSLADALMCGLLALLSFRRFGARPAWATGFLAATYAPFLYFGTELAPVPFTLLLLVGGLLVLDVGLGRGWTVGRGWIDGDRMRVAGLLVGAGILLGLAVGTRPNLLLGVMIAPLLPWTRAGGQRTEVRDSGAGPAPTGRGRAARALLIVAGTAIGAL